MHLPKAEARRLIYCKKAAQTETCTAGTSWGNRTLN